MEPTPRTATYREPARTPKGFLAPRYVPVRSPSARVRLSRTDDCATVQLNHITPRHPTLSLVTRASLPLFVLGCLSVHAFDDPSKLVCVATVVVGVTLIALFRWSRRRAGTWDSPDEELAITPHGVFWQDRGRKKRVWSLEEVTRIAADACCVTLRFADGRAHEFAVGKATTDRESMQPLSSAELEWLAGELRSAFVWAKLVASADPTLRVPSA